jgi:hypothetical protein
MKETVMNCEQAQNDMLDSLLEAGDVNAPVENHIATCEKCQRFLAIQQAIDAHLTEETSSVALSPQFRAALRARLDPHRWPSWIWPEWLPDLAHLIGCISASAVLMVVFPEHAKLVATYGAGFTGITYFLQAIAHDTTT